MVDYKMYATAFHKELQELIRDIGGFSDEIVNLCEKWDEDHYVAEYPLPEWAEARNPTNELVVRAQLCTKDGRRMGNARVVSISYDNPLFPAGTALYLIRTDVGSEFNMLASEVHGAFYVGHYIMKPDQ